MYSQTLYWVIILSNILRFTEITVTMLNGKIILHVRKWNILTILCARAQELELFWSLSIVIGIFILDVISLCGVASP